MNKVLSVAAFAVGLAVVAWVGAGYLDSGPLALAMTGLIGVVYVAGAVELLRFDRATATLERALAALPAEPPHLVDWLRRLPATLQNPVRLRIEGERVGLPGPALTPYLVGLLVLLGMLGTFLGMVLTLDGAVSALESSGDLQAIRSALAAPVKGLGFAFGTSIAGVAASAMLGLVSALCRRERLLAAQGLDTKIATSLRGFSRAHQREAILDALQSQARSFPQVMDAMQSLMRQIERQGTESGQRLLLEQERFHREATKRYSELAGSVDTSLKESLTESARLAGETIRPVVSETMAGIARETSALQQHMSTAVERQLEGLSGRFDASVATVTRTWTAALASHERSSENITRGLQEALTSWSGDFEQRSAALHARLGDVVASQLNGFATTFADRSTSLLASIEASAAVLQAESASSEQRRQAAFAQALEAMARSTIDEVTRLMQTASEAPRAAAEIIGQLRQELSASIARDNELTAERKHLMESLGALSASIAEASTKQHDAIEALVASSTELLERAGKRFEESVEAQAVRFAERGEAQSERIVEAAGQVAGSAVEMASLGEAFGHAVRLFGESSERQMATLQRIEDALERSAARSDEQLAYYVAQAREIIDLSIMSQRQIVEDLQRISGKQPLPSEA